MGMFGYICSGCNKSINTGEQAIMIHIRHGKVCGSGKGTYDGYGRVDDKFRQNDASLNGHEEICKSEFFLPDGIENDERSEPANSGIAAYHVKCFAKPAVLKLSRLDPNQAMGKARKAYS